MKGQRREHQPGDLFVIQLDQDGSYRFGRVVMTGPVSPDTRFPGEVLVYLYSPVFTEPAADSDELTPDRLLMAPLFTTKWMWHKGYFRTVDHRPLESKQLLAQHCFYSAHHEGYVDENDRRLDRRYEPCGSFAFPVFEYLEEEIDAAVAGNPVPAPYPPSERT
jgi:hypothetical protein